MKLEDILREALTKPQWGWDSLTEDNVTTHAIKLALGDSKFMLVSKLLETRKSVQNMQPGLLMQHINKRGSNWSLIRVAYENISNRDIKYYVECMEGDRVPLKRRSQQDPNNDIYYATRMNYMETKDTLQAFNFIHTFNNDDLLRPLWDQLMDLYSVNESTTGKRQLLKFINFTARSEKESSNEDNNDNGWRHTDWFQDNIQQVA